MLYSVRPTAWCKAIPKTLKKKILEFSHAGTLRLPSACTAAQLSCVTVLDVQPPPGSNHTPYPNPTSPIPQPTLLHRFTVNCVRGV